MINLLSPEDKRQLRAARINVLLLRYTLLIGFTLVAVAAIFGVGLFIALQEQVAAERDLNIDHQQTAQYQEVREEAERFENNLNIASRILADEITYSTLLVDIAKALPGNVVLTNLTLNPEILNEPTTLEARTVSYEAALTLQTELEESPLFSAVDIQNIATTGDANPDIAENAAYPVSVTLSVVIANPNSVITDARPEDRP